MNHMGSSRLLIVLGGCIALTACGGSGGSESKGIDPHAWSCESLAPEVIAMSKGKTPEIFEISNIQTKYNILGQEIKCIASAEWSQGTGFAEYGAHVSDGGSVMLEYAQD